MKVLLWSFLLVLPQFVWSDAICTTAFELRQGMILVEGDIDGQRGWFILDTGSPGLVLNKRYFSGTPSETMAYGIHQKINVEELEITLFRWQCIEKKRILSLVIDLTALERGLEQKLWGLIGYEIFRHKELIVDYELMSIEQRSSMAKSKQLIPDMVVFFEMSEHLPIVSLEIEGSKRMMILDSGSESNIITENLGSIALASEGETFIMGLDQVSVLARIVQMQIIMPSGAIQMEVIVKPSGKYPDTSGLLGASFLKKYRKWSINYYKQRLSLWQ